MFEILIRKYVKADGIKKKCWLFVGRIADSTNGFLISVSSVIITTAAFLDPVNRATTIYNSSIPILPIYLQIRP